jgi:hypothetical protein
MDNIRTRSQPLRAYALRPSQMGRLRMTHSNIATLVRLNTNPPEYHLIASCIIAFAWHLAGLLLLVWLGRSDALIISSFLAASVVTSYLTQYATVRRRLDSK